MLQSNLASLVKEQERNGDPYQCDCCDLSPAVTSRWFIAAINHEAASINEENRLDRSRKAIWKRRTITSRTRKRNRHDRDKGECLSVQFQLLGASLRLGRIELSDSIMISATQRKRICPMPDRVSSRPS